MYLPNLVGGFQELEWGPPSILPPEMSRRMHTQHGVSSQESTLWSVGSHHRLGKTDETWWRHQMETFSALLGLCPGNEPVTGEFPSQRPVLRSFDVFFHLLLNKRLSKQSWGWWFETPSHSLWRHCNSTIVCVKDPVHLCKEVLVWVVPNSQGTWELSMCTLAKMITG